MPSQSSTMPKIMGRTKVPERAHQADDAGDHAHAPRKIVADISERSSCSYRKQTTTPSAREQQREGQGRQTECGTALYQ